MLACTCPTDCSAQGEAMVTTSSASQGSCTQECLPRCNAVTLNSFLLKVFIHGPILPSLEVKISYHIYTPSCSSVERDELFILHHSAVANDTSFPSPFVSHASMLPSPVVSNASGRSTSVPETAESAPHTHLLSYVDIDDPGARRTTRRGRRTTFRFQHSPCSLAQANSSQ